MSGRFITRLALVAAGIWAGSAGGVGRAACETPVEPATLSQRMSLAEAAYVNLEAEVFQEHLSAVRAGVACLPEPLSTSQATALFRLEALDAFLSRDSERARAAFWSVLATSPNYTLSPLLAPEGHPLQALYMEAFAAQDQAALSAPLPPPRRGTIWIDGLNEASSVPLNRPYLFQYADEEGVMVMSQVVLPGQPVPEYVGGRRGRADATSGAINPRLAVVAGVVGVAAGGMWAAASVRDAHFNDPSYPIEDPAAWRSSTNALSATSWGLGAVAVGTGAVAVLQAKW